VFECGDQAADDYDRRLFVSWCRFMRANGMVATEEQWQNLNEFTQYVTGLQNMVFDEKRSKYTSTSS